MELKLGFNEVADSDPRPQKCMVCHGPILGSQQVVQTSPAFSRVLHTVHEFCFNRFISRFP